MDQVKTFVNKIVLLFVSKYISIQTRTIVVAVYVIDRASMKIPIRERDDAFSNSCNI